MLSINYAYEDGSGEAVLEPNDMKQSNTLQALYQNYQDALQRDFAAWKALQPAIELAPDADEEALQEYNRLQAEQDAQYNPPPFELTAEQFEEALEEKMLRILSGLNVERDVSHAPTLISSDYTTDANGVRLYAMIPNHNP